MGSTASSELERSFPPPKHHVYPRDRVLTYRDCMERVAIAFGGDPATVQDALGRVALALLGGWPDRCAPREQVVSAMEVPEGPRLFRWALGEGVLVEVTPSRYAFGLDQVRDYLAARYLVIHGMGALMQHWYEEGWEGVLPLVVAYRDRVLGDHRGASELLAGLHRLPRREEDLHVGLLLRGLCLGEAPGVDEGVWAGILRELVRLVRPEAPDLLKRWLTVVFSGVCRQEGTMGESARDALLRALDRLREEMGILEHRALRLVEAAGAGRADFEAWRWTLYLGREDSGPALPWGVRNEEEFATVAARLEDHVEAVEAVTTALAHGLSVSGELLGELLARLDDGGPLRVVLVVSLGEAGAAYGDALPLLLDVATGKSGPVGGELDARAFGFEALLRGEATGEAVARAIASAVADSGLPEAVRVAAAMAAAGMEAGRADVVGALKNAVSGGPATVREAASAALAALGGGAPDLPPTIEESLASEDPVERGGAAVVAARLAPGDDRIPRILLEATSSLLATAGGSTPSSAGDPGGPESEEAGEAEELAGILAEVLGELAETRPDAREVLLAALTRGTPLDREAAGISLALLALRYLDGLTDDPLRRPRLDPAWQRNIVEEALRRAAAEEDPVWSELALTAAALGRRQPEVAAALVRLGERDLDGEERAELAAILAAAGVPSRKVWEFLRRCLAARDPEVILAAIGAVGELPSDTSALAGAEDLVDRVFSYLGDGHPPFATAAYSSAFRLVRLPTLEPSAREAPP